jgi:hypothetical protein
MRYEHILPVCDWCKADITEDRLRELGARIYVREFLSCSREHAQLARKSRWRNKPGNRERQRDAMRKLREKKIKNSP